MIFCSVGTQAPFERLMGYLSEWSLANPYVPIIAQVGNDQLYPDPIKAFNTIAQPLFSQHFEKSRLVVSHAGMGNIIRALELGKPLVIVPRDSLRGEHINNHQYDTADNFRAFPSVFVARDQAGFFLAVNAALNYSRGDSAPDFTERNNLIAYVKSILC